MEETVCRRRKQVVDGGDSSSKAETGRRRKREVVEGGDRSSRAKLIVG